MACRRSWPPSGYIMVSNQGAKMEILADVVASSKSATRRLARDGYAAPARLNRGTEGETRYEVSCSCCGTGASRFCATCRPNAAGLEDARRSQHGSVGS